MSVLVVGGAGYIGAHIVRTLSARGCAVVVADDLSTGVAARVAGIPLARIDLTDANAVDRLSTTMRQHGVNAVVHLAAKKQVAESVAQPTEYYRQNVGGLISLLDAMRIAGVGQIVFSSSAAVFGNPVEAADGPVSEAVRPRPISPYGESKLIGEWLCRDAARAWGLRWTALRYFNVVGAGAVDLGDTAAQNLMPQVFDALDRDARPVIFGDDYPTSDGTCVRDYVHVSDLAEAHVAALDWLDQDGGEHAEPIFNVGTGQGSSVRDVLAAVGTATGREISAEVGPRRPGDPAILVADVTRIERSLGWSSRRTLLDAAVSAWDARRARTTRSA